MKALARTNFPALFTEAFNHNGDFFLTPFDEIVNQMIRTTFPSTSKELGVDVFSKRGTLPRINIKDFNDRIEIDAEIPSWLGKDDVSIDIHDGVLTIAAEKNSCAKEDDSDGKMVYQEISRRKIQRQFLLNDLIDHNSADASFNCGILTITLKKLIPVSNVPKKISIK